jgi:hypothetical protein
MIKAYPGRRTYMAGLSNMRTAERIPAHAFFQNDLISSPQIIRAGHLQISISHQSGYFVSIFFDKKNAKL